MDVQMELDENATKQIENYILTKRTYPYINLPIVTVHFNPHRQRRFVSYGIIAYAKSTERFLLVQRRYSTNYFTLLRGAYRRSNIAKLVAGMCVSELQIIRRIIYRQANIYDVLRIVCSVVGDHNYAAMRFENHENDILHFVNKALADRDTQEYPEWLFPKGKSEKHENSIDTAFREFYEETGVAIADNQKQVINQHPIVNHYQADNDFVYETRYWIVLFDEEIPVPSKLQSYEVVSRAWKSRDEIETLVRPHQLSILREASTQIAKK